MAKNIRVTLTKTEAASAYGQRLIHQILAISNDGDLIIEEVHVLHAVLLKGPADINAVEFLRVKTGAIISDGQLDQTEMYDLRCAMERVVPKDIRSDLTILLSRIGLPSYDEVTRGSWEDDPITTRQLEFINNLGGAANEQMTKGQGAILIEELLERRPPSPRQQMVLRFFDRLDLMSNTKEEVSIWMDGLYAKHEDYERAWHLFKADIGDDGTIRDPSVVPLGAYRNYLRPRPVHDVSERRPRRVPLRYFILIGLGVLVVLLGLLLLR